MSHVFLQQRERFRAATIKRLGLSDELFDQFNRVVAPFALPVRFRKGEYLQRSGEPAQAAFWLHGGVARRGIVTRDGADLTMGFATDGELCLAHHDLLAADTQQPALEFIVAESPVSAVRLDWSMMKRLRDKHDFMREYYMKVSEHSLKRYSESCYMRSIQSAEDRLRVFREFNPELEERISQKALASFLGITPQYMSTLLRRVHSRGESAATNRLA